MAHESVNPRTRNTPSTFHDLTDAEVELAIEDASNCFVTWRQTTFGERSDVLANAAAILRARTGEFARPLALETGRRVEEARAEVGRAADILDHYARDAGRFLAGSAESLGAERTSSEDRPIGVILRDEPRPVFLFEMAHFTAPNLMAGNVILASHQGCVPRCATAFERLLREAGAPRCVYANVMVSRDQADRLRTDPRANGEARHNRFEAMGIREGLTEKVARDSSVDAPA